MKFDEQMVLSGKRVDNTIPCACGCGERLLPYDRVGRERRFINGHNVKAKYKTIATVMEIP